jgi:hypothetical protein
MAVDGVNEARGVCDFVGGEDLDADGDNDSVFEVISVSDAYIEKVSPVCVGATVCEKDPVGVIIGDKETTIVLEYNVLNEDVLVTI